MGSECHPVTYLENSAAPQLALSLFLVPILFASNVRGWCEQIYLHIFVLLEYINTKNFWESGNFTWMATEFPDSPGRRPTEASAGLWFRNWSAGPTMMNAPSNILKLRREEFFYLFCPKCPYTLWNCPNYSGTQ